MTKLKKGLGRGFDVLIPKDFDQSIVSGDKDRIQNLFIKDIRPNPDQPRKNFDKQSLSELAESIKRYGVLQPLIASPKKDGSYNLVAGERRYRAAQIAGLDKVPVIVRERKEQERLEVALIENVQRVDLDPLEQAISIEKLHQQFNLSYKEIGKRLGKADTTVANLVRLLGLPKDAMAALHDKKISEGHARAILALKDDPDAQAELLKNILVQKWTVRQAERFVIDVKKGSATNKAKKAAIVETPETRKLGKKLETKVTLHRTAKGGKLELHYSSDEELETLIKRLSKT